MTTTMTDRKNQTGLSPEEIIQWLRDNPDFLNKYPEACDLLSPPRAHAGKGIVDFQTYMVQRLRQDREEIIEEAREIVETSRANMSNQARIHKAVVMLLDAQNFEDFINVIVMDFASLLDVDIVALIVEAQGSAIPHINLPGVQAVSAGTIDLLMKNHRIVLESHIKGVAEIYGGGAGLVKSQAFVRLHIARAAPQVMLAFGSRNPDLFQPGQGTELTVFLASVVERCFRSWLDLPPL